MSTSNVVVESQLSSALDSINLDSVDTDVDSLSLSGTNEDRKMFEALKGREVDPDEAEINFMAALNTKDFENMLYLDEMDVDASYFLCGSDTDEGRQKNSRKNKFLH